MARTLVLGAGFGGITVSTELKRLLGDEHEVVLVDRAEEFSMGLRKLWELVGHATIADGSRPRELLREHGIDLRRGEISAIDPAARSATVNGEVIEADYLVIALGAVQRPDLVPGLAEHGHDIWSTAGIPGAASALAGFESGKIVVLIAGAPYPCPPAPFECVLHVDEQLRARGIRDGAQLAVATLQPMLMPNAGEAGSAWMAEQLTARDISFQVGSKVERVEPGVVHFAESELEFDLLFAIPPHRAPDVVREAGLLAENGWMAVDPGTFATTHERVFAVGDVNLIPLANGLPLPKAGIIAELEGARVAAAIVAAERGGPQPEPFDGIAACYVEMGPSAAARVDAEWYTAPAPLVSIAEPSAENAAAKRRFESERLERWFGS